jgi:hypothetical protein
MSGPIIWNVMFGIPNESVLGGATDNSPLWMSSRFQHSRRAFIELVIPAWAIINENARDKLQSKRTVEMLPSESRMWLGLSRRSVPAKFHQCFPREGRGSAAAYLLAEVILLEPLNLLVDESERAKLNKCRSLVVLMEREASSLTHALTLLSQASRPIDCHTQKMYFGRGLHTRMTAGCVLIDLRLMRVMKSLQAISSETAVALR